MNPRYAILLDGGFVTKALAVQSKKFPTAAEIRTEVERIQSLADFNGFDLLRVYFYDAPPATSNLSNPLTGEKTDLGTTEVNRRNTQLLSDIELLPNFALRKGETVVRGWMIGKKAQKRMMKNSHRELSAKDLVPNIQQKGVDLRIGLDVSRLALTRSVQAIVLVTGDSDMIPVFKFARREGVRMYLNHMGMPIRRDLRAHADVVLPAPGGF